MGGTDFSIFMWIGLFLFGIWFGGRFFAMCKQPPILGQLVMGIFMGPKFMDLVPYASNGLCDSIANPMDDAVHSSALTAATASHAVAGTNPVAANHGPAGNHSRRLSYEDYEDDGRRLAGGGKCTDFAWGRWETNGHLVSPWNLLGNLGVTLMIMESGMHIHFDKVAQVGAKAFVIAIFGTLLPLIFGMLLVGLLFDGEYYPSGFAAGCAFAPTSVGISIKLLEESKMLNSMAGQTTLTAAFIDDVFSLVTLVMMIRMAEGDIGAKDIIIPIVGSFVFLAMACILAIYVFTKLARFLGRMPKSQYASIQPRDEMHLFLMLFLLAVFGFITWVPGFIGSHLLGAFGAGMCFVNVPRSQAIWGSQLKRIVKWLMRIFFSATVGFAIPIKKMFEPAAFGKGLVLGIVPVIGMKLVSGLFGYMKYANPEQKERAAKATFLTRFLQPQQLLIGVAMVARGEFAYLVADTASSLDYLGGDPGQKMMSEEVFASVMWGLVMATIFAPVAFRWVLGVYERANPVSRSQIITNPKSVETGNIYAKHAFNIRIAAEHHVGVQREVLGLFHQLGIDVLEAHVYAINHPSTDKVDAFVATYNVLSRGKKKDFDDEKLEEMHHQLLEVLDDPNSQIIFGYNNDEFSQDGVVEIQVLGDHHPDVLHELTDALAAMQLDVLRASVEHTYQPTHGHTRTIGEGNAEQVVQQATRKSSKDANDKSPQGGGKSEGLGARSSATSQTSASGPRMSSVVTTVTQADGVLEHNEENLKNKGTAFYALRDVARNVFYAKEQEGSTHQFTEQRRIQIEETLKAVLAEHDLSGSVIIRVLHESEMPAKLTAAHSFNHQEKITVIRCVGTHHAEVLHEICDRLFESNLDVLNAQLDQKDGKEEHVFYVQPQSEAAGGFFNASESVSSLDFKKRQLLREEIANMYVSHGITNAVISVLPMLQGDDKDLLTTESAQLSPVLEKVKEKRASTPGGAASRSGELSSDSLAVEVKPATEDVTI